MEDTANRFNGGPGNCPAKLFNHFETRRCPLNCFNGGPGNCPAKLGVTSAGRKYPDACRASMEGRAIARPNWPITCQRRRRADFVLQWRAGQLPGQTPTSMSEPGGPAGTRGFNGGPGNCPAKQRSGCGARRLPTASMEGRAIARPNSKRAGVMAGSGSGCKSRFNGGPGNCPAKRQCESEGPITSVAGFNGGPGNCPAKRHLDGPRDQQRLRGFNGGPGNCPAKRAVTRHRAPSAERHASMEGRAIARPNDSTYGSTCRGHRTPASMEGRAIARPNPIP